MLRLIRHLNNNAGLVRDKNGQQIVVMGLGIAFQKKKGDLISEDKVEKSFFLKDEESKNNFIALLKDVPFNFISITYDVIDLLLKKYSYSVQDYLYITLTDHIYCSYLLVKNGNYQNSKLMNLEKEYALEYEMAREALNIFNARLYPRLPEDEVGRIALHFINAQRTSIETSATETPLENLLTEVEKQLKAYGIVRTNENGHYYDRLMIHLSYFYEDIQRGTRSQSSIQGLDLELKKNYPKAYEIGEALYQLISERTGLQLYEGERIYLILHIQHLL